MSPKPNPNDIKKAVERLHDCKASFSHEVAVIEKFGDKTVWSGVVSVFKIKSNDQSNICYAWTSEVEGSTKYRYYAVLHVPPVDSPQKAVRASIVQDFKTSKIA